MFVKNVKQRLEVRFVPPLPTMLLDWLRYDSGTVMPTQKTCLSVLLLDWYKLCCTQGDSSRIMCITFLAELKTMVCPTAHFFSDCNIFYPVSCFRFWYYISVAFYWSFFLAQAILTSFSLGTGAVYSFDPVGSYEREACRAAGAAQSLVQPFLDNQVNIVSIYLTRFYFWSFPSLLPCLYILRQIYFKNQLAAPGTSHPAHLPLSTVLSIVIDSFTSATERHIEVCSIFLFIIPNSACCTTLVVELFVNRIFINY